MFVDSGYNLPPNELAFPNEITELVEGYMVSNYMTIGDTLIECKSRNAASLEDIVEEFHRLKESGVKVYLRDLFVFSEFGFDSPVFKVRYAEYRPA